jgi:AhpD family alkylhydroperoxidase
MILLPILIRHSLLHIGDIVFQMSYHGIIYMHDWIEHRNNLLENVGKLERLSPDSVSGYLQLGAAGAKTDRLGGKVRQLISLAVAVTTRCDGCISVHAREAVKEGATEEDIAEALGVAMAMNAGAALVYSTRALEAVRANKDGSLS